MTTGTNMNPNNPIINTDKLINLNEKFVVTKKYNGKTYYFGSIEPDTYYTRPGKYATGSRYKNAKYAILFKSQEEAQKKADELNTNRQKIKFKIEPASYHFVSNFSIYFERWNNKLSVSNRPISIQDYAGKEGIKANTRLDDESVKNCLADINIKRDECKKYIQGFDASLQNKLNDIKRRFEQEAANLTMSMNKDLETQKTSLSNFDEAEKFVNEQLKGGTLIEPLRTPNDDKFDILYGKAK